MVIRIQYTFSFPTNVLKTFLRSLLIRYPYELTVRGVLKYHVIPFLPFTQMHSARVCQVSRIDPATGDIHSNPEIERSICDDPSPIETIY